MKHTPGPWKAEIHTAYSTVTGPKYFNFHYAEYAEADDARLVAAAPDLLAACQKFVDSFKSLQREKCDVACQMAKDAIAKAEGKSL